VHTHTHKLAHSAERREREWAPGSGGTVRHLA
jgi:hypothetical protein